jgi:hypothetical protein
MRLITFGTVSAVALVFVLRQAQHRFEEMALEPATSKSADPAAPALAFAPDGAGVFQTEEDAASVEPTAGDSDATPRADHAADDPFALDAQLWEGILDKKTSIRPRPYYHLVSLTNSTAAEALQKRARSERDITLAHLATDPEKYRGHLIYLEGQLRGLVRFDATSDPELNPAGIRTLYQGDLFTTAAHPYQQVTFAGFFLQLWRYKSAGGVDRVAPLLVGRMVNWTPTSTRTSNALLAWVLFAVVAVLVAVIWTANRGAGIRRQAAADDDALAIREDLARLEDGE